MANWVLDVYGCPRWPTKKLDVLELNWCICFSLMHQGIYMDDQDDPWCIWMSIVAQVVSWCTKGFMWMLKMTLSAAGCHRYLLMHKLCLNTPTHLCGWLRWPLMRLDVFDVCRCTTCVSMHKKIDRDDQDDNWCSWMSWMSIDAKVVPWCSNTFLWMIKMTLDAAGCSRWPLMQLDVPGCILM